MARTAQLETLEQKIEKAQQDEVKTKNKYDLAVTTLNYLMDYPDAPKRNELFNAILKSDKSYDLLLRFIQQSNQEKD